ncbi:phage tail assembly chaperone [Cronobacter turicensis]|uniref:Bacteriophage protein n=1 Tax=Cronobacter turicensis (strain DSM 18703 / CCUG 55852 / LMG 23827 / z3032) TaxID=693216 RepID=C9XZP5_CROTZ|nr:hypothetical protein [Cronobacter turicensis]CBA33457.1 hypothetical protein CTU_34210 [Cronobacter turicensis z3032]ELY5851166.1 hypothetical protein [Cronobacter turicensis]EMD9176392.1 hypothetical protein [Cronobacter turicensis]MDI6472297.1 hypothetical protein [Cronobacter turicensis]MDK1183654.1 hypothetical protein [Cronobacter turicensis]
MEITIKGANYRIAKLSVFDQLRVSRKLLPVLAGMAADFRDVQSSAAGEGALFTALLPKIAEAVSALSDEDCNAILHPCLAAVSRDHMKAWVPVFRQGELAFDDICLMTLLQLAARVVADSLGNFLQELPGAPTPGAAAA